MKRIFYTRYFLRTRESEESSRCDRWHVFWLFLVCLWSGSLSCGETCTGWPARQLTSCYKRTAIRHAAFFPHRLQNKLTGRKRLLADILYLGVYFWRLPSPMQDLALLFNDTHCWQWVHAQLIVCTEAGLYRENHQMNPWSTGVTANKLYLVFGMRRRDASVSRRIPLQKLLSLDVMSDLNPAVSGLWYFGTLALIVWFW